MGIRIKLLLAFAFLISVNCVAQVVQEPEEQPEGLMETMVLRTLQDAPFQVGAFRIRPAFLAFGQYDSNSFSEEDDPQDDSNFQASPAVRALLPFRSRALLELYGGADFIYYNEFEDLRGAFYTTGARFTIGGHSVLFTIADTLSTDRVRPTQEYDFPADQRLNQFDSSLTLALGRRTELEAAISSSKTTIQDDILNPLGVPLSQFFDRSETIVHGRARRHVSEFTAFVGEVFYEDINFAEQSAQPDANTYGGLGGFEFQARGNITGKINLGYKRVLPDVEEEADFSGLVGLGAIKIRLGERTVLGLEYSRDARPSVSTNNWFFIENRIAPSIEYFIARPLSIYGQIAYGKNSYPRPGTIVTPDGQETEGEIEDDTVYAVLAVRYKIKEYWQVFVLGNTISRNSNLQESDKDRNLISSGVEIVF